MVWVTHKLGSNRVNKKSVTFEKAISSNEQASYYMEA